MYDTELPTSDMKVADYVGNKYISFNYSVFDNYLMVEYRNVTDRSYREEKFDIKLSRETYTIGSNDTSLYIFDPESLKEYEIDYESNRILEVGNISTGILYFENGEKKRISVDKVNEVLFNDKFISDYENTYYEKIDKVGNKYGYYYLYKKDGNMCINF